ncbi:MAG: TIGR02281 family clan AA aspartic protease [Alphaproteobacteria bacterium]
MAVWLAILCLIIAAIVMMFSNDTEIVIGLSHTTVARIAVALSVIIFLVSTYTKANRDLIYSFLKQTVMWGCLFVALMGLYTYRGELATIADKIAADFHARDSYVTVASLYNPTSARIKRNWSGQFIAQASIDGQRVDMLIDTGASMVVLRYEDAKRLNLDMKKLKYTVPVHTANGSTFAARVRLREVFVDKVGLTQVEALVAKRGSLHQSLLGMSFLSRLRSYEFSRDRLELRG